MRNFNALAAIFLFTTATVAGAQEQPLANEEELKAYLELTRGSRVLLREGELRASVSSFTSLDGSQFGIGSASATEIGGSASVAYGVTNSIELFLAVPFGHSEIKSQFLGDKTSSSNFALGSVVVGGRFMIAHETGYRPEITGTIQLGAPTQTGGDSFTTLGASFDALVTLDPFILTSGIGFSHGVDSDFRLLDLNAGATFGVSDRVAIGADLSWVSDLVSFGDPLRDAVTVTARMAITFGHSILEPSIGIGLTETAPDVTLGLGWSWRF